MEDGSLTKDLNNLRSTISGYATNITKQITEVERDFAESERENDTLLAKAKSLSKRIIETQEEKLKLLNQRHDLLFTKANDLSLMISKTTTSESAETLEQPITISSQQEAQRNFIADGQEALPCSSDRPSEEPDDSAISKMHILTSEVEDDVHMKSTTDSPETLHCSTRQHLEESNDLTVPKTLLVRINTEEATTNKRTLDEPTRILIDTGFNIFNASRKENLRKLRQTVPKFIDELSLTKKKEIRGLDDELISCAAGWHGFVVVITNAKILHFGFELGKLEAMYLAQVTSCVDILTRHEVILGDQSGCVTLMDVMSKESYVVCQYQSSVTGIKVHPNRVLAISTISCGAWSLINIVNREILRNQNTGSDILGLDIHPNGAYVATSTMTAGLQFWDLRIEEPISSIVDVNGFAISFLFQGNWILTCTESSIKILDTTKYPGITSNWKNPSTYPIGLNKVDPSGRIISVTMGKNLRVLELIRTENKDDPHIFKEILNTTTDKPIVHVHYVEQGIWLVLKNGEMQLYSYSC